MNSSASNTATWRNRSASPSTVDMSRHHHRSRPMPPTTSVSVRIHSFTDQSTCCLLALTLYSLLPPSTCCRLLASVDACCISVCCWLITGCMIVQTCVNGTHHSKGRFCDFLLFFAKTPGGQTPELIVTQNGLNDADSDKDVPFGVKLKTFCSTSPQSPKTTKIWPILVMSWKFFARFHFSISGLTSKHP